MLTLKQLEHLELMLLLCCFYLVLGYNTEMTTSEADVSSTFATPTLSFMTSQAIVNAEFTTALLADDSSTVEVPFGCDPWDEERRRVVCLDLHGQFPQGFPQNTKEVLITGQFSSIPSYTFSNLHDLQLIEINAKSLNLIEGNAFHNLTSIIAIAMSGYEDEEMKLGRIESHAFSMLRFGEYPVKQAFSATIRMSRCKLQTISAQILQEVELLSSLVIKDCVLQDVEHGAFHGLGNILRFSFQNVVIKNGMLNIFDNTTSIGTYELMGCEVPILSSNLLPPLVTNMVINNNVFEALERNFLCAPFPAQKSYENNTVNCNCRISWVYSEDHCVSQHAINSFTCYAPAPLKGESLETFSVEHPLVCDDVTTPAPVTDEYAGGGLAVSRTTIIVVVTVTVAILVVIIIVLVVLVVRKKSRDMPADLMDIPTLQRMMWSFRKQSTTPDVVRCQHTYGEPSSPGVFTFKSPSSQHPSSSFSDTYDKLSYVPTEDIPPNVPPRNNPLDTVIEAVTKPTDMSNNQREFSTSTGNSVRSGEIPTGLVEYSPGEDHQYLQIEEECDYTLQRAPQYDDPRTLQNNLMYSQQ